MKGDAMPNPTEEPSRFGERLAAWEKRHAHRLPWMWFGLGVLSLINVLLQTDAIEQAIANPADRSVIVYALMTVVSFGLAMQAYARQCTRNDTEKENHTTPA